MTRDDDIRQLVNLESPYAEYNAQKTLSTKTPSAFVQCNVGGLVVTRDDARDDPYYNRIVRLDPTASSAALKRALAVLDGRPARVEVPQPLGVTAVLDCLSEAGFSQEENVAWWGADRLPSESLPDDVVQLTQAEHALLRELLETDGAIDPDIWEEKQAWLFAPQMQWFGMVEDGQLAAAASLWTDGEGSIFGSALTRGEFRRRGMQQRLLEARRMHGARKHFVDVEPQSVSERNCRRAGFALLEQRQIWTRTALS